MKKRTISVILIAFICVIFIGVGATLAYLIASTHPVVNTFTVGDVKISLTESTDNSFKLIPGVTHKKDPVVTVKAGSSDSWLFIKAHPSADLYLYVDYSIDSGWTPLEDEANVYYRRFYGAASDTVYPIIKNNTVTIHESISEGQLELVRVNPTLTFTAYAAQADGFATPDVAWDAIIMEKGE